MEVDVRVIQPDAGAAVAEHAERQSAPTLHVHRAIEKGAALDFLGVRGRLVRSFPKDGQRVVARGGLKRWTQHGGGLPRRDREAHGRAVGERRAQIGFDRGCRLPQEVRGLKIDAPARDGDAARRAGPRGDGAAPARQAEHPHPGGVFTFDQGVTPAVLAERQEHGGIRDAFAVVKDSDGHAAALRRLAQDDVHAGGARAPGVLKGLGKDVRERSVERARDTLQRRVVDARADGGGVVHRFS